MFSTMTFWSWLGLMLLVTGLAGAVALPHKPWLWFSLCTVGSILLTYMRKGPFYRSLEPKVKYDDALKDAQAANVHEIWRHLCESDMEGISHEDGWTLMPTAAADKAIADRDAALEMLREARTLLYHGVLNHSCIYEEKDCPRRQFLARVDAALAAR